ncbi:MAG: hypothetical protein AAF636_00935 [Pseudomonadota bacterium]
MAGDLYSQTVSFFKVVLPLIALGLLSTLFLLSRVTDPSQSVPFAEPEIRDRLLNQQVTEPYYSGMSSDGDEITFTAAAVTTPGTLQGAKSAEDVKAQFRMSSGSVIDISSEAGLFDLAKDHASLTGDVVVVTSEGYVIRSERMIGKLSTLDLQSPETVTGVMPGGDLEAGSMTLTAPDRGAPAHLVFNDGVKLIYDPRHVKD